MTVDEYRQQQLSKGAEEWGHLMAMVEVGKHPTAEAIAYAILEYGIDPYRMRGSTSPGFYQDKLRAPKPARGATQTAPDLCALTALAAVSAAVRGRADVLIDGRDWRETVNRVLAG